MLCLSRGWFLEWTLGCFVTSSLSLVLIQYKLIELKTDKQKFWKSWDNMESVGVHLKVAVLKSPAWRRISRRFILVRRTIQIMCLNILSYAENIICERFKSISLPQRDQSKLLFSNNMNNICTSVRYFLPEWKG